MEQMQDNVKLIISNDAYYYFTANEEPLDDNSFDEIAEIEATFENGFNVEMLNAFDTGEFEVNIIPKKSYKEQYDGLIHLQIKNTSLYLNIVNINIIKGTCINEESKKILYEHEYKVIFTGRDKKPSLKGGVTQLPLWTNDVEIWNIDKFNENIISD